MLSGTWRILLLERGCLFESGHYNVAHLAAAAALRAGLRHVGGAIALSEHRAHRALDARRALAVLEGVAQQHRRREDRRERIGEVLAGDVGRAAVHRLVQAEAGLA